MRGASVCAFLLLHLGAQGGVSGFTTTTSSISTAPIGFRTVNSKSPLFSSSSLALSASTSAGDASAADLSEAAIKKEERKKLIKKEGGLFAFDTKYGALNPYAIYYGAVSIFFGIPWLFALYLVQLFYKVTGGKIDKQRKLPVLINHAWGVTLMRLTFSFPRIENRAVLKEFFKSKRPAMFVANHCSWDDIPFLGATIGWRNYKIVSKKELEKVPILGKAIRLAGNVEVDRADKRSQLATLKKGIQYLKDGIHLCTFAEGTRSRSGRLMKFKDGAFKMAYKAGAPIIPITIVGAQTAHPTYWMFPFKPSRWTAKVIVGDPIESKDFTEAELSAKVREEMIAALPEDQKPEK